MAAVSHYSKSANVVLTAVTIIPFVFAILAGLNSVMNNPSSVIQVSNSITLAFSSYFTGYVIGLPGALLFDYVTR
jgi:hypothetical protein